ncbi:Crp/Fnr family transcriptional regulator [Streptomyces sp. NPDC005706]|uniref:Crp/Fnr family transcriptional regulator n=1 Tax=Streptomyces sp. NPDC005706 TaxID=3157169 RepID=UPI0033EA9291
MPGDAKSIVRGNSSTWPTQSFLAGLERPVLDALVDAGELTAYRRAQPLIRQGDSDTDVLLLLSSCVKVVSTLPQGGHALLAVRVGGDVVGEQAALDGGLRSASVVACGLSPVLAVRLARAEFERILSGCPAGAFALAASVSRKLRASTRRRVDYTSFTTPTRLARVLLEMADDYGHVTYGGSVVIGVDLTQLEWGTLIGVKASSVERALRELRDNEIVAAGAGRITVRDMAALRALALPGESPKPPRRSLI